MNTDIKNVKNMLRFYLFISSRQVSDIEKKKWKLQEMCL